MRHTSAILATVLATFSLTACGPSADVGARASSASASLGEDLCPRPDDSVCATDDYHLLGGQHIDTGTVRIDNDGTNLLIQVTSEDGWQITEVHIFAGTGSAPVNKKGTVVPGHFPYNTTYATPVTTHTQVIPLADLGVGCGDTVNTVVHAVVRRPTAGGGYQEETAFGDGTPLPSTRWGFSSTREICCEPPPPPPPPPPPEEECPEAQCVETIEYWAANTSIWPGDNAAWVICWSPETGGIPLTTAINTTGSSALFDALVDEIAAAANNQGVGCANLDCVTHPALMEAITMVNDCHITDDECARAEELIALLRSFNDGTYDYNQCND